ncbi:MbnP family protein [Parasediminibacterium sp. JCM 36343]|uniref:MbnP family protein n=1 Tax=Parasediminibacterium sp. JCM 36343 TaxID=3374279 RepID=UPI00397A1596
MAVRKIVGIILLMIHAACLSAQPIHAAQIVFHPAYNKTMLHLADSAFVSSAKDSLEIDLFKFYISGIELWDNNQPVWKEPNSYHLINAMEDNTLSLSLNCSPNLAFNKIKFNLGIDSSTNFAGVQGGDLDPMRGMYWTWQSGYINFKLEGKSPLCQTLHHEFEFHLGGYHSPYNTLQTIVLPIKKQGTINILADIQQFIAQLDLAKQNHIMTPGKEAAVLASKVSTIFSIIEP